MKRSLLFLSFLLAITGAKAQSLLDSVPAEQETKKPFAAGNLWKSSRLISFTTTQPVSKGTLEFRVTHRFGDIATPNSHFHSLFGFDVAEDILIHFEYGVTERLAVSAGRTKGTGPIRELWQGGLRYSIVNQTADGAPLSVGLYGNAVLSTAKQNPFVDTKWTGNFSQRLQYMSQVMVARQFGLVTVQLSPTFLWRNYVAHNDANGLVYLPVLLRGRLSKRVSLVGEFAGQILATGKEYRNGFNFSDAPNGLWNAPLHVGVEIETGGHTFTLSMTNSAGILENDLLAYNNRSWDDGEFRFGFSILRWF